MRVVTLRTLRRFWESHADAEDALRSWNRIASRAAWRTPEDIKVDYPTASILRGNRVVFNVRGNHYRLITVIHYNTGFVYVRFIGPHREYDEVDALTV